MDPFEQLLAQPPPARGRRRKACEDDINPRPKKKYKASFQDTDWIIVCHKYDEDGHTWYEYLQAVFDQGKIESMICQHEQGHNTDKKHWQMFVQFKKKITLFGIKKHFKEQSLHIEQRRGTCQEAWDYCMKDETAIEWCNGECDQKCGGDDTTHYEWGTLRLSAREKGDNLWEELFEGATLKDVALNWPDTYAARINGIREIKGFIDEDKPKFEGKPELWIYWGQAGTGKSFRARQEAKFMAQENNWKIHEHVCTDKWWKDYRGEEIVIMDEFDPTTTKLEFPELLMLTQAGPKFVQQNYGNRVPFQAQIIIMTSNLRPSLWFLTHPYQQGQLQVRVDFVKQLTTVFKNGVRNVDLTDY